MLPVRPVVWFSALWVSLLTAGHVPGQDSPHPEGKRLRSEVLVRSDLFDPLPGVTLRVRSADGLDTIRVTDKHGISETFETSEETWLEFAFQETRVPGGLAIGQLESRLSPLPAQAPANMTGATRHKWRLERTQPVALPVVLEAGRGGTREIGPDGLHTRWSILTPRSGNRRIHAHVGMLMHNVDVQAVLAYYGASAIRDDYRTGWALHSAPADLESPDQPAGFLVRLDTSGRLRASLRYPIVDAFYFASDTQATHEDGEPSPEGKAPVVQLLRWEQEQALIHVRGHLPGGWLVLALRPAGGPPGSVFVQAASPPDFAAPPSGSGSDEAEHLRVGHAGQPFQDVATVGLAGVPSAHALASIQDCVPSAPRPPDWSLDPVWPMTACGIESKGEVACHSVTFPIRAVHCASPGVNLLSGRTTTRQLSVSNGAQFNFEPSASDSSTTTDTVHFSYPVQPGEHGLGQCVGWFETQLVCVRTFAVWAPSFDCAFEGTGRETSVVRRGFDPCGRAVEVQSVLVDVILSSTLCSRTP